MEYPYQQVKPMGGTDSQPELRKLVSIEPRWFQDWEKEQADKLASLRLQVWRIRTNAFNETAFGSRERKLQSQAMVNAYDVVLSLIDKKLKE